MPEEELLGRTIDFFFFCQIVRWSYGKTRGCCLTDTSESNADMSGGGPRWQRQHLHPPNAAPNKDVFTSRRNNQRENVWREGGCKGMMLRHPCAARGLNAHPGLRRRLNLPDETSFLLS